MMTQRPCTTSEDLGTAWAGAYISAHRRFNFVVRSGEAHIVALTLHRSCRSSVVQEFTHGP